MDRHGNESEGGGNGGGYARPRPSLVYGVADMRAGIMRADVKNAWAVICGALGGIPGRVDPSTTNPPAQPSEARATVAQDIT